MDISFIVGSIDLGGKDSVSFLLLLLLFLSPSLFLSLSLSISLFLFHSGSLHLIPFVYFSLPIAPYLATEGLVLTKTAVRRCPGESHNVPLFSFVLLPFVLPKRSWTLIWRGLDP